MSAVDRRVQDLDTIAAVLPMERRDELAELLTDQDIETLRHLVNQGMGANTLRALTSDVAYLQAWSLAATGHSLPWPAPEAMLLKFVAHHLWDVEKRLGDPEHGMPADVEDKLRIQGFLRAFGPHAPDTVRRRLATWSTLTKWRGLDGFFGSPALKSAIRLAVRATPRPRKRKSAKAVTGDILSRLIATCSTGSLRDVRDRAILMVAFASGGRRRSEIAGLRVEQLQPEEPIRIDGAPPLPSLSIHLGRTKTSGANSDEVVYLSGRPVDALNAWLAAATIDKGSVFRSIDRWGNVSRRPLDPKAINDILKHRAERAGLDPAEFSAHGSNARSLIEDKSNAVLVSAVSFYELDNKMRLKKLDLKPQELRAAITSSGFQTLAISDLHAELAAAFDWEHRDPWDRILAAQTRLEHCALISTDVVFDAVLQERVW